MRRTAPLVLLALLLSLLSGAADARTYLGEAAGPSAGGISSDNVEFIKYVPGGFNVVGGRKVGKYWYVNDQHKIMIFDVSDPLNPTLTGALPMPQEYMYSREDLDTNGTIMVVPNTASARSAPGQAVPATTNVLFIVSVEDKTNPQIIAELPGAAQHTFSCVLDCTWAYGSDGNIVDLRDPANPKLMKEKWDEQVGAGNGHDVQEVSPGIVLTATQPITLLDVRMDPRHPKLLAVGDTTKIGFQHTAQWPVQGKSDFLLMAGETNNKVRCSEANGAFQTWDARNWKNTHSFQLIDQYRMENGTYIDGKPPANVWGCSSHWHEANPHYGMHGGLVAAAFFEHGVRFIDVSSKGKIEEVGYFMPHDGNTGAVYWITDRIAYTADYNRGIDIIKWNGDL
jgi:hypothetical protein